MSRTPFWQPGGTWQPPIVRLKGVDEKSPVGQQLFSMFEGKIKQFYLGQARAHMLGVVDNSRATREFPDARMTYTNTMGQEVVDVEVRPELVESVEQAVVARSYPDWLLVEFVVADGSRVTSDFTAFVRTPDWRGLDFTVGGTNYDTNLGLGHWGLWGPSHYGRDERLVSGISPMGGSVPTTQALDRGAPHRNTFVVDLRRLRHWPTMTFDFYGWVTAFGFILEIDYYSRSGIPATSLPTEWWSGYYVHNAVLGDPYIIVDSDILPVGADVSEAVQNYQQAFADAHPLPSLPPITKSTPDPMDRWESFSSQVGTDLGSLARYDLTWYWTHVLYTYRPIYKLTLAARDVVVDVRHRIFTGGDLDWRLALWQRLDDGPVTFPEAPGLPYYPYDQEFRTWEHPNFLGSSLPTARIATAEVQVFLPGDDPPSGFDPEQHYGRPYFGTYTLAQEHWGGSWSVAP